MIQCEVYGLDVIQKSNTISVPKVYCEGEYEDTSFIVLEYLEFQRGSKVTFMILYKNYTVDTGNAFYLYYLEQPLE